jgi:pSer/pThr/pTyr-binding forkhead associated (FHA) protein
MVDVEPAGDEVRIGRRAGLEIQLPFATISSLHARVVRHGKGWALLDMGSVNGTFVGEARLQVGIPRVINPGELLKLADVSMVFEGELGGVAPPPKGTESTATIARRLVNDLFQAVSGAEVARIIVETGNSAGKSMALATPDRPYKIGRSPECDLVLSDDAISREHAAFERRWQGVFVRDLGSKNGIEIDGKKVRDEQRIHDGELLTVGSVQLRVDDPEERYLAQMEQAKEASRKPTPAMPAPMGAAAPATSAAARAPAPRAPEPPPAPKPAPAPAPAAAESAPSRPATPEKPAPRPPDPPASEIPAVPGFPMSRGLASSASAISQKIDQLGERTSRVLPFFVTIFSLAVLGGVAYLVWLMFFGMGGGARP